MGAYWLMKSEPEAYSLSDLRRDGTTGWSGVRNYEARNMMRRMRVGDLAFFYHSNAKPSGVAGVMEVCREAYPDPTAGTPLWSQVDVRFVEAFPRVLALSQLKRMPALRGMALFERSRLSVQPVSAAQWRAINRAL